ncbi:hypothetical protein C1646_768982, partial [Rhizophagus diaphanus]
KELINYLKRKDLKLNKDDIKIFCKEKVAGHNFLKLTEEKLECYRIKGGPAIRLVDFIKGFSQKLQNYFSLKTLNNLKKILHKNKVNRKDITNIKQFTPVFEEISDNNKAFEHCIEDIILKLSNIKTIINANKTTHYKFILAILYALITIAKKLTSQDILYIHSFTERRRVLNGSG